MSKVAVWTALLSICLVFPTVAKEKTAEFSEIHLGENMKVMQGRLSGYGKSFIVVHGHRLGLCENYQILDQLDHPISLSGLSTTEVVQVTVIDSCAAEVRVLQVRK